MNLQMTRSSSITRRLGLVALIALLFGAPMTAFGQSRKITPNTQDYRVIEQAIAVVRAYEEDCGPHEAGAGPVANELTRLLRGGSLRQADFDHEARYYDLEHGGVPEQIIIHEDNIPSQRDVRGFVRLVAILYHYGKYAVQEEINHRAAAWARLDFLERMRDALLILFANLEAGRDPVADMDECQEALVTGYIEDETGADAVAGHVAQANALLPAARRVRDARDDRRRRGPAGDPPPDGGAPRLEGDKSVDDKNRADSGHTPGVVETVELPAQEEEEEQEPFDSSLDTGLSDVFAVRYAERTDGVKHLLIAGHRDGAGAVQVWRDSTPGVLDPFVMTEEIDVSAATAAPSALLPFEAPTESGMLVWDELAHQLYAILDTNADGIPDTFDPAARNQIALPPSPRLFLASFGPDEYGLTPHVDTTVIPDVVIHQIADLDQDGNFENTDQIISGRYLEDPRLDPSWGSTPMIGIEEVWAHGVPGHELQLWTADDLGTPLAPLSIPAVADARGEAALIIPGGIPPGLPVIIVDNTSGNTSFERPVEAAVPSTSGAEGNSSPGEGGAFVWQRGTLLHAVTVLNVRVGGVDAPSFFAAPDGIFYETPPNIRVAGDGLADEGMTVTVAIDILDTEGSPVTLFGQPVAYIDPRITDEYACRRGNVNAGAGSVTDIVTLNGWAGAGNSREILLGQDEPFTLHIALPPGGGNGKFAFYVWVGTPSASSVNVIPQNTGMICMRTPISGGPGLPKKIANNIGKAVLGEENWPGPPTQPAPNNLLLLPNGLGKTGTFTMQGIVVDPFAQNGKAAVTNAVVVETE